MFTRWEGAHFEVPVGSAVAVWRLISKDWIGRNKDSVKDIGQSIRGMRESDEKGEKKGERITHHKEKNSIIEV